MSAFVCLRLPTLLRAFNRRERRLEELPSHRRLKRRKVVHASRRLAERYDSWLRGDISFADFDASVQGWINHVRYADTWGLRKHVLKRFPL